MGMSSEDLQTFFHRKSLTLRREPLGRAGAAPQSAPLAERTVVVANLEHRGPDDDEDRRQWHEQRDFLCWGHRCALSIPKLQTHAGPWPELRIFCVAWQDIPISTPGGHP